MSERSRSESGLQTQSDDAQESGSPINKFVKEIPESSFDWYKQDESGKLHRMICRRAKIDGAYSRAHDTSAKKTYHAIHAKHSNVCNKYGIVEKGHENRAKKKKKK